MQKFFFIFLFFFSALSFGAELTLTAGGFGIHTLKPSPAGLRDLMPRKIDENGHFVITPGFGAVYRWENQLAGGLLISDSFSNPAFAAVYGYEWPLNAKHLSWGVVGGVYLRKSMKGCHAYDYRIICISNARDLPVKINLGGGPARTDVAPILGLQLNYAPIVSPNLRLDVNFVTALYISLITFGLRFDL